MRAASQQVMLDSFFGSLCEDGDWARCISDRGFAQAGDKLAWASLERLNTFVVKSADALGLVPRWYSLHLVAANASVLMPAVRPCHTTRHLASSDQRLFALYLPGAESSPVTSVCMAAMVLNDKCCLRRCHTWGKTMCCCSIGATKRLGWWPIRQSTIYIFVCCCERSSGGWDGVRSFARSDQIDAIVTINIPSTQNCADYVCSGAAPQVRLVKCITPDGRTRVLATNLLIGEFPVTLFAELFHQRWRIEEAFKWLKHRCKLESFSGLTHQALLVDVYAKVLADNLGSLVCQGAEQDAELPSRERTGNRAYAEPCLQRLLPRMALGLVLGLGSIAVLLEKAFSLLGGNSQRQVPDRKQPRPKFHVKPHPSLAYKG